MNYHIWHKGIVIESFSADNDDKARAYARQRYTHFAKCTDDDDKVIYTKTPMTEDRQWLLDHCIECDGAEIPQAWWEDAEAHKSLGHVTISGPRGPNGSFKRITPT
ncbi:hypothetical protein LCGC14_0481820 [marine sediment metagenome]|uniref:Uncharacterized protein n=1 Tax=marine sediment metagenome TaxID=412755 RepID=A0A0F9SSH0_9ZZZZ